MGLIGIIQNSVLRIPKISIGLIAAVSIMSYNQYKDAREALVNDIQPKEIESRALDSFTDYLTYVPGAPGTNNGAVLRTDRCEWNGYSPNGRETDQRWYIDDRGYIVNELSGRCLDIAGAPGRRNGAKALLWDCEYGWPWRRTDQRWRSRE